MKCIKKSSEIVRVQDGVAATKVTEGWSYCPKSEWKKFRVKSRKDKKQAEDEINTEEKHISKYAKKKQSKASASKSN